MREQRVDLHRQRRPHVLEVVLDVGLEEEEPFGPVRLETLLGKEVRVTGGDDAVDREPAGLAMVGVQAVALPRIVSEQHAPGGRGG